MSSETNVKAITKAGNKLKKVINRDTDDRDEDITPIEGLNNDNYADRIDPTLKFLYKPHSICTMALIIGVLIFLAFDDRFVSGNSNNVKFGLAISSLIFIFIGMLQFQNGPFIRPHPAFWRAILATSILYLLLLIFLLFQVHMTIFHIKDVGNIRQLLKYIDGRLGVPLPEVSYSGDCSLTLKSIWVSVLMADQFIYFNRKKWMFLYRLM